MGNAAKVGALTIVFVALVWVTALALNRTLFAGNRPSYRIRFADAGGVQMGTRVRMAGVQIGVVGKVELLSPTLAQATFQLDRSARIPPGTVAVVPTSLVGLGESNIDLVPPPNASGQIEANAIIEGRKSGPLEGLFPGGGEGVKGIAGEAEKTLKATRRLLEDPELIGRTKALLTTLDRTMQKYSSIGSRVDGLLASNQATLQNSLHSVSRTMANVEATSAEVAKFAKSGKLQNNVDALFGELRKTTAQTQQLIAQFNKLATDPALTNSLANVQKMTESGTRIAASAEKISKNGEDASASAARIAKTSEATAQNAANISARLVTLTDKANAIAERATLLEDQLSAILGKFGGRRRTTPGTAPATPAKPLRLQADVLRETDPNRNRVDLTAFIPLGETHTLSLGIFDAFESNRITAQYGTDLGGGFGVRYGIYAGKPAVGVDYALGPRLSLRGDLWSLNSPRLDFRAQYEFRRGVVGWVGLDRTFGANAPTFGIGIRR